MAVSDAESRRGELEIGEEDERRRVADERGSVSARRRPEAGGGRRRRSGEWPAPPEWSHGVGDEMKRRHFRPNPERLSEEGMRE